MAELPEKESIHTMPLGKTGSGKTTLVSDLIEKLSSSSEKLISLEDTPELPIDPTEEDKPK